MYEVKLNKLKVYYLDKMKSLSCRFKSSVERMNETIQKQQRKFQEVKQQRERERQATKNHFHKSLSRIRESFNRGKDMLNDDIEVLELAIKEIKRNKRNENIQNELENLKWDDYDSDLSEFDKYLFDNSGRLNISQIKSALLKDDYRGLNHKSTALTNSIQNLQFLLISYINSEYRRQPKN